MPWLRISSPAPFHNIEKPLISAAFLCSYARDLFGNGGFSGFFVAFFGVKWCRFRRVGETKRGVAADDIIRIGAGADFTEIERVFRVVLEGDG